MQNLKAIDPIHPDLPAPPAEPIRRPNTPNYKLPLWRSDTVTSWMTDLNYAMSKIDTIMHNLELRTGIEGSPSQELADEVIALREEVNKLNETKDEYLPRFTAMEQNYVAMNALLTTLTSDMNVLRNNQLTLDSKMDSVLAEISTLRARIDKLDVNFTAHVDEFNEFVNDMHTRLDDIEEINSQQNENITTLSNTATQLENVTTELSAKTDQFKAALETDIHEVSDNLTTLTNRVDAYHPTA